MLFTYCNSLEDIKKKITFAVTLKSTVEQLAASDCFPAPVLDMHYQKTNKMPNYIIIYEFSRDNAM